MKRRNASRNGRKGATKTRLVLEALEDRTLLSVGDGSFQDVMLTNLRNDPKFAGIDGQGIGVAVIDSGVDAQNPEIQPNFVHWYDAISNQDSSYTDVRADIAAAFDPTGHGTHVAGIVASSNADLGVAYGASIIGIRALPAPGEAVPVGEDPLANGLQWVIAHWQQFNIRVVNLSVGDDTNVDTSTSRSSGDAALIAQLESLGVTVVAASGNDYADFAVPGVSALAAAATVNVADVWATAGTFPPVVSGNPDGSYLAVETQSAIDRVAASSQRSSLPNQVAAPGQNIYSDWNGAGGLLHNTLSGTSMSAALVSGAVALMQQAAYAFGGQYLNPSQVLSTLRTTADTIADYNVTTNGRVPNVNGQADLTKETALPETGLSLQRVNVYHALQSIQAQLQSTNGGSGDPTDPNGSMGSAIGLGPLDGENSDSFTGFIGSDGSATTGPDDVDMYQFSLEAPGSVSITLGPVSGEPGFDSYLRFFDSSGNQIAANNDISATDLYSALLTAVLQAGTYFLGVSSNGNTGYNPLTGRGAANGNTTGGYQLTVNMTNPDPNGTIAGAVSFAGSPYYSGNLGSDPVPTGGTTTIGPQDVDMYEFVAPGDGELTVFTSTFAYGAQAADTYLRVFDEGGGQLAANHGGAPGGNGSQVMVNVTAGEIVYVGVSDASNTNYDPNNPYNRTATGKGGLYDVGISFDDNDQNGTTASATTESVGQTFSGTIGTDPLAGGGTQSVGPKDLDVYALTPGTSGLLDISVSGQNGFIPDVAVVAVSQGKTVSIGSAVQAISDVQFLAQAGQTYYLFITGSGNGNYSPATPGSGSGGMTGNYTVTTSLQPVNGSGQTNGSGGPTPVAISQGGAVVGNIGTDGSLVVGPSDIDLYQFTAPATETVAVHTGTSAEGSADTYLRIFDAQGNEIAHNAHFGGISTDSLLVLRVVAGQTYLIGVNGYSANAGAYNPLTGAGAAPGSTGNYLLTVTGPPTSAVQALPAFSAADFALNWSGTPAAGGPAIDHFDVYVSDNGGPYKLLLTHTLQTATTFHGVTGHTYSFYSIATDQFGNSQASPLTPQAATRVDTTPPVSSVAALPTFSPADFRVDWSGTDDPGGSGVASYDVYVSDNGGPFQALLTGTAQTSVSFHGVAGHIYAFYSVATDRMGNRQATPASAQAVTRIDATPPVSSVQPLRPANSPTFLLSWSGSDDTGGSGVASYTVFVSDNGAPYQPFISGTTQTSAVFHGSAGHSYAFYSIATDWAGNVQATPAAAQATTLAVGGIYATGADAGGGPEVKVYDAATGNLKFDFFAFSPQFTGGVRVAVGDVNGDGYPDVIAAAGPGGGPDVRVFDGQTGALIRQFFAFDSNFTGGVYVAAGDVNGDRDADIICGADAGGGPSVTVFSGNDGSILSSFFAFAPQFTGGVRVAAGDISADGHADIIAAAGPGGGPQVNVFSGADGSLLRSFFAYAPGFTGGVYVAAADVNGDGRADIITGAGPGGGPQINVFSGADNSLLQTYLAYASDFTGGVRVAAVDANGGGFADVVTVAGPGGGPQVRSINPLSLQLVDDFFALDPRFSGGLYVAGG